MSSDLRVIASRMDLENLNKALYRCDQEERDETSNRFGVYDIPGYGPLVYAGLQGKQIVFFSIVHDYFMRLLI